MPGKAELKLAYQTGALSIINRQGLLELDDAIKEQLAVALEAEFELWYAAMAPLFALVGNGF